MGRLRTRSTFHRNQTQKQQRFQSLSKTDVFFCFFSPNGHDIEKKPRRGLPQFRCCGSDATAWGLALGGQPQDMPGPNLSFVRVPVMFFPEVNLTVSLLRPQVVSWFAIGTILSLSLMLHPLTAPSLGNLGHEEIVAIVA